MGRRPLFIIMSEIKRLTLVSDPTNEFPNNANNSFKVRLPERLMLPGTGWHAALMSLTVPDQGQSNAVIAADPHTKVLKFKMTYVVRKWIDTGNPASTGYRRVETKTVDCEVELEEIMNAHQIVSTGSMFWQRVMQEVNNKIMHNTMKEQIYRLIQNPDEKSIVSAKKNALPRLTWKRGALVIQALSAKDLLKVDKSAITDLFINLAIALKFGLVLEKTGQNNTTTYEIGPNLQYTLPTSTYGSSTKPNGAQYRTPYNWEGEQYMGINPILVFGNTGSVTNNDPFHVVTHSGVKFVQSSFMVEWRLSNLDASFEKIVGTRKRTVMVYSDLVESTVVGSGKFPLLREVQLLRTGDGESTAEPLHHQWIKVRGQQMDILEVEIASTHGPLAILPPGKTLVTIGLKQL